MLHCVLNPTQPNQDRFLKLLSIPKQDLNGLPLYLIQNHGEEVYFNKAKVKKTKTKRQCVSVLEAVIRTRNFHLAKPLFNCIPEKEKTEALKKRIKDIKAEGIWGMPELQAAYKNFFEPWKALYDAKNWGELDKLTGLIGQALKEHLPWFSLYLFCHPVSHSLANYTQPPNWVCILLEETELDLDLFGPDSTWALYKGLWEICLEEQHGWAAVASYGALDAQAFKSQGEVISSEFDNTIRQFGLEEPELKVDAAPTPGT